MPRLPFSGGRMNRALIISSMFCRRFWAGQKRRQSLKTFLPHSLHVGPRRGRPVYLIRAINQLNEAKAMNRWTLYKRILETLFVVVPFLVTSSIQDAAAYLSRTPTAFSG